MKHQKLETTPEISKRMSRVSLKGGKAEVILQKALWHKGIRYRKNYKKLPGSPDIAITKHNIAVFIDGGYWHGKDWETKKEKIKSNKDYWLEKIAENIARDNRNDQELKQLGWTPIHFWDSDVLKDLSGCVQTIIDTIFQLKLEESEVDSDDV